MKRTTKDIKAEKEQAALQDLAGIKKKRGLSLYCDELIQNAFKKADGENSRAPVGWAYAGDAKPDDWTAVRLCFKHPIVAQKAQRCH